MNIPFFRKSQPEAGDLLDEMLLEESTQIITTWGDTQRMQPVQLHNADPVRQAAYGRIGLVSVGEEVSLPDLLAEATQSTLMQQIMLPVNPRIASEELYELDGMDFIIMLSGTQQRITRNLVRWVNRLKQLQIPLLILLPNAEGQDDPQRIDAFSRHVGVPVVTLVQQDTEAARQAFLGTAMQVSPAMGLALAAHLPTFRTPLMHNMLGDATENSLVFQDESTLHKTQKELARQISAAYGCNGHNFDQHQAAIETLMQMTNHYTTALTKGVPMRDETRRVRFTNALSTLLIGYGVANYFGAEPPSFRKELLPTIWRLYRASRRPVSA